MSGTITTLIVIIIPLAAGGFTVDFIWRRYHRREIQKAYHEGVQEGQKVETEHAVRNALADERMALKRRLHDNGRRHHPRPGAEPVRMHKAKVGLRKPGSQPL